MRILSLCILCFFSQLSMASKNALAAPSCDSLIYPNKLLSEQISGKVHFDVIISAGGRIVDYSLVSSSGHKGLDKEAVLVLFKCKFVPGKYVDGAAPRRSIIEINYKIEN